MTDEEHAPSQEPEAEDAGGAKQSDNPGVEEIAGTGGEGEDQGGLGDRTGGAGGAQPTEPDDEKNTGQLRK